MKLALLLFSLLGMLQVTAQTIPRRGRIVLPTETGAGVPLVVTATEDAERGVVTVKISDSVFTELHEKKFAKPILFPIIGPTGAGMTRQWPVVDKAGLGEEMDHPHHKGLWFTHGAVNSVDFWAEGEKMGKRVKKK